MNIGHLFWNLYALTFLQKISYTLAVPRSFDFSNTHTPWPRTRDARLMQTEMFISVVKQMFIGFLSIK